jgi:hypothetical protein
LSKPSENVHWVNQNKIKQGKHGSCATFLDICKSMTQWGFSNTAVWSANPTFFLFVCAYNAWVISPPCPHPLPYHSLRPLHLPPTPSIPSRNYFALISNFVEERV